jgi:hypothetical protein
MMTQKPKGGKKKVHSSQYTVHSEGVQSEEVKRRDAVNGLRGSSTENRNPAT